MTQSEMPLALKGRKLIESLMKTLGNDRGAVTVETHERSGRHKGGGRRGGYMREGRPFSGRNPAGVGEVVKGCHK